MAYTCHDVTMEPRTWWCKNSLILVIYGGGDYSSVGLLSASHADSPGSNSSGCLTQATPFERGRLSAHISHIVTVSLTDRHDRFNKLFF